MLSINSSVCTPFGFRYLSDLKEGDIISNPDTGGQERIIQIHPMGTHEFIRLKFIDGTYTDCSEGHLWKVKITKHSTKRKDMNGNRDDWRIWDAKMIYDWLHKKEKQGVNTNSNLVIPLCEPVQFTRPITPSTPRPIDPYILGVLIGDGCFGPSCIRPKIVNLTTPDQFIVDKFIEAGYDMSHCYYSEQQRCNQYRITNNNIFEDLKTLKMTGCVANTKFIPERYKYSTIEERKALIRGLIDTDGYIDSRGHISYTTVSSKLAEDVAFVCRSLGAKCTITSEIDQYKDGNGIAHKCQKAYTVYIMSKFDRELVSLPKKLYRAKNEFNGGVSELCKRIVCAERIGKQTSFCITVDNPTGLYISDDFTVTHNSYLGSCWLVSSCMLYPDIRAVVARKTLKSLKGSTWNTIKKVCKEWGLKEGENYKINNLDGTMTFWNDSVIIMQEMVDLPSDINFERFGSSEYTIAFIDEVSEISERAVEVLFSRLRWRVAETFKTARMLMTTNPCLTWVRSRFVQDDEGNKVKCRDGEAYVPFSVFDNPDTQFVQTYVAALNKITDKATRERLLYGNWDFVGTNLMAAYWNFDGTKHLVAGLREKVYDPMKPIISGWDFNVAPYMSELEFQIDYEKKEIYILEENLGKPESKENNTPKLAAKIREKHIQRQHLGGIIVTGDPAGLARSTQTEENVNNYTIIVDNMRNAVLRPRVKLLPKQPPQATRLEFVNALLNGYGGWKILVDLRCRKFTEDMVYQQKNSDGTKQKKKVLNPKTKGKEEKYGHLSDILDYVLVLFLNDVWKRFQNQKSDIETYTGTVYNAFEY